MVDNQFWPALIGLQGKLGSLYQDEVPGLWEKYGINNVPGAFIIFNAHYAGPEGLDPAELRYRNPYAHPRILDTYLQGLVDGGFLETNGTGRYFPSTKGTEIVTGLMNDFATMFDQPTPAAAEDLQRLIDLLQRLVEASEEASAPPVKTALIASRRLDRGPDAPVMARLNRYLGDLNAYRDDVHLAAWGGLGISGPVWEALTAIWNDTADHAEKLAELFSSRQYAAADYAGVLAELAELGWVVSDDDGHYALTDSGRAVREEAEKGTDRTFYACWDCLSDTELAELQSLIQRVGDAFQPPEEPAGG
jgi:hypothetical protein